MESMRWVGVDVHAKESLAAVLNPATGEISTQRITGRPGEAVVEWLAAVAQPFRARSWRLKASRNDLSTCTLTICRASMTSTPPEQSLLTRLSPFSRLVLVQKVSKARDQTPRFLGVLAPMDWQISAG